MPHSKPDQRRALITKNVRSSKWTAFIHYRNSFSARPIINLPIDLPVLRADNGRLAVFKTVYINEHKLASDYFKVGQDTDEIQALLQSFLITLSQVEHGPIFQELK